MAERREGYDLESRLRDDLDTSSAGRSFPLEEEGLEGFSNRSFGQILFTPPLSKRHVYSHALRAPQDQDCARPPPA